MSTRRAPAREVAGAATSFSDRSTVASTAYSYTVAALDAAGNASAQSSAANVTTPAGGGTALSYAVAGSYDDMYAFEDAGSGSYSRTSTHVFTADNTPTAYDYRSGFRYRAVAVPAGATITSASLTLTADATPTSRPSTTVKGEAADNPADYTNDNHNTFLARARTTAAVTWAPSAWTSGVAYTSPDLSAVVQEIVSRPGWASGNALALFWEGADGGWGGINNRLSAYSYDGNPAKAASLALTYTVPDLTLPSTPSGLTATSHGPYEIDLSWTAATDNVAVQGYRIYRDASLIATTASTTYADTGLVAGSAHTYTVAAVDGAGNVGNQSTGAGATTDAGGSASRASYTYTYNRAGQRLSEASTISGDPTNGTATFAYDPLARLTSYAPPSASSQTYAWDPVPNRTSLQVGANPAVTTSFDAANRPTSASDGASYSSDLDGRLTARPGQRLAWDDLSRLTNVKPSVGETPLAAYTYDGLDRLRTVTYADGSRIRFRYVGLSTAVDQVLDDASGQVQRSLATGLSGERLFDWTNGGLLQRFYGTNAHGDTTWTAGSSGLVSATLRYDPWGSLTTSTGSSLPDWRWQGSWFDTSTNLYWVVSRWYAPSLGRFMSEDDVLGASDQPPTRHLYAYGAGNVPNGTDPDGAYTITSGGGTSIYGSALPQIRVVYPNWNDGGIRGRLTVATFIPDCFISFPPLLNWYRGRGDCRSWSNPFYPDLYRARIGAEIDFDHNWVRFTVRPSCGVTFGDCHSAYPLSIHSSGFYFGFVAATKTNVASASVSCGDWVCGPALNIWWSVHQSYYGFPLNPTIDGGVRVRPCKNWPWDSSYKKIRIEEWGDGYPAAELYYTKNWSAVWGLRANPSFQGLIALATGVADWHSALEVPW